MQAAGAPTFQAIKVCALPAASRMLVDCTSACPPRVVQPSRSTRHTPPEHLAMLTLTGASPVFCGRNVRCGCEWDFQGLAGPG